MPSDAVIAPDITTAEVSTSVTFRKTFGLRADEYWIRQVASDPDADRVTFGVPLSKDELADLKRRNSLGVEQMELQISEYGSSHSDDWAGMFIDQARGGVFVVQFSDHLDQHEAALASVLQPNAAVEFRSVSHSLEDLQFRASAIKGSDAWFRTIQAVLVAYGVDEVRNKVLVRISSVNPDAPTLIAAHFGLVDTIYVESDDTGSLLLPKGGLRVFVIDQSGKPVKNVRCEPHPDNGSTNDEIAPRTDADGRCNLTLPATGVWIFVVDGSGPTRRTLAIGRAVILAARTMDLTIEVSRT